MGLIPGTNIDDPTLEDDPCGLCRQLVRARQALISGDKESEFSYLANGVTRSVSYSLSNLAQLKQEIEKQRLACIALQMGVAARPLRHAIQFGSRSHGRRIAAQAGGRPQIAPPNQQPPAGEGFVTAEPNTVTLKSNAGTVVAVVKDGNTGE